MHIGENFHKKKIRKNMKTVNFKFINFLTLGCCRSAKIHSVQEDVCKPNCSQCHFYGDSCKRQVSIIEQDLTEDVMYHGSGKLKVHPEQT